MNRTWKGIWTVMGLTGLILTGCGSQGENESTQITVEQTTVQERPLSDIYAEIEENVELPKMLVLNDNYIANYFGIDLTLLEDYVFTNAEEVIYADTVIMMKAKADTDKESLKEALNTMIEHKKAELENYLPEQFKIVEKSKVQVAGDYVYLIISDKEEEIEAVMEQYIK